MPHIAYALSPDCGARTRHAVAALGSAAPDITLTEHTMAALLYGAPGAPRDAVWIHLEDPAPRVDRAADALTAWLTEGGRALLTMTASQLVPLLGHAGEGIEVEVQAWHNESDPLWPQDFGDWPDYPHIRGMQGWGSHPLFAGFMRGTFSWAPQEGEPTARCVMRKSIQPADARRVVAVDRAYVQLDTQTAVAWEYEVGRGRVLCLGANLPLEYASSHFDQQKQRLLLNALRYVASREAPLPGDYWPDGTTHASVRPLAMPRRLRPSRGVEALESTSSRSDQARQPDRETSVVDDAELVPASLSIVIEAPDVSPVILSTGGVSMIGNELHGLSEVWLRELCVMDGGVTASIDGMPLVASGVTIAGDRIDRHLRCGDGSPGAWVERWIVSPGDAACSYELWSTTPNPPSVRLECAIPLRLQWPIPTDALAPLRVEGRRSGQLARVRVTGCDGQHGVEMNVDGVSDMTWHEDNVRPRIVLSAQERVQIVWCASTSSSSGDAVIPPTTGDAQGIQDAQLMRLASLGVRTAQLHTDTRIDESWQWAMRHLSGLMAPSPFGGTRGLLAGVAASRSGWGVSRPGYAWLFGRDTCWCIDAMLVGGLHDEVAECLRTLASTCDISGKVAHEVTLSGVVHYDAADASPLFLRAVAAYWEWTGDVATIRELWPAVRKALVFIGSCDRDDDGLPENTGVGHGWIESGPLGGGHVTSYVAAIWIDALTRLAAVATAVGDVAAANDLLRARTRALASLDALRDRGTGRLALHRTSDGALVSTLTALSAVPLALHLEPPDIAGQVIDELSSPAFAAPWGLRLLSAEDPSYNPRGYHSGAIWPLYTGWMAIACAEYWRTDLAATHILSNADLIRHRAKGAFDEVLHGDSGEGAGVCPLQAWSAAMSVSPIGLGLLGLRPSASEGSLVMRAQLPSGWPSLRLNNLRVGSVSLDLCVERLGAESISVELRSTAPLHVTVEAARAADTVVALDGREATRILIPVEGGGDGKR